MASELTPAEQKFFETGELQPGMQAILEPPAHDPVAAAALASAPAPAPAPAVEPPKLEAVPPAPGPQEPGTVADATEILRRSLMEAQARVGALEQFIQQQSTAKPADPKIEAPNPDVDPLGSMMHQLGSLNKTVTELQAALTQQQTQQTQVSQFQQFQNHVRELKDEFVKSAPDFNDAFNHLRNGRIADLRALGMNDQQIKMTLFQEETSLAESSIRNGRNPAEVLYEMSKRHGYTPRVAGTPAAPAQPDAKLTAIQQAQAAARNLPSTPNVADITLDGLKNASDDDLNKMVLDPKVWSKITGTDQYPL